jgi:single-stranded-DNA-specific exonuclease
MKRKIWKHTSSGESVRDFLLEKTGYTFQELSAKTGKNFKRFAEVKAALFEAKKSGRTIVIVGDYDSDGINSIMILTMLCFTIGVKFKLIIPKREAEGYGLSFKIIDRIEDGVMLITVDNGITAVEQMKEARRRGMYTIILDHHTADNELPDVDILIDPSAIGEADYTHYCGAGIAYRLAEYILGEDHPLIPSLSVFAAVATIGDVVELTGDNRQIVIEGMKNLKAFKGTAAFNSLLSQEEVHYSESITSTDIAFNIVPIINAPERLADGGAETVCKVLLQKAGFEDGVRWLIETNTKRKELVGTVMEDTYKKLGDSINELDAIVYADKSIPLGIAGIIAGNISQETGNPTFIFGYDAEGNLKGSARCNIKGMNIISLIRQCKDELIGCGGHSGAAGLSLKEENLESFTKKINALVKADKERLVAEGVDISSDADCVCWDVKANDLNITRVTKEVLDLEPCGCGMPAPSVRIKSRILKTSFFGGKVDAPDAEKPHIRFKFASFEAVGFNMNSWYQEQRTLLGKEPRYADIVGVVTENIYKGNKSMQFRMKDFEIF